ncbi:MAG: autotransporter outer membrane beta-barrel domain-containing protein [Magnetococcales bacterium]|nr:autotransporter outer membrane beta-barrel domain-containing protein [Magnetococcales bacterium]
MKKSHNPVSKAGKLSVVALATVFSVFSTISSAHATYTTYSSYDHNERSDDVTDVKTLSTSSGKQIQIIASRASSSIRAASGSMFKQNTTGSLQEGGQTILSSFSGSEADQPQFGDLGREVRSSLVQSGISAGDMGGGLGGWLNVSYINSDDNNLITQSDSDMWMIIGGIDKKVLDDVAIGLALTYEDVQVDTNLNNAGAGFANSTAFSFTPYAAAQLTDNVTIDGSLGVSWVNNDKRNAAGATASYDSERYFMAINLNGFTSMGAANLSSSVGWLNSWENQDGYTDSAATVVAAKKNELSQLSFTGEVAYPSETVEPYMSMRLEKDITWTDIAGVTHDEYGVTLGGGVRFMVGELIGEINGDVDVARAKYDQFSLMGNLRYEF